MEFIGLYLLLAGFILGLGAVSVIELHGFLGRHSPYWNEATIRTHKITKPLIWTGLLTAVLGGIIYFYPLGFTPSAKLLVLVSILLVLNGSFLSFVISPYLLKAEKEGKARELLPRSMQRNITLSFIFSFLGWWGALAIIVNYLVQQS